MIKNTFGKNIIPLNDEVRVKALRRYHILDTPSEASFDNVATLAREIFDVPIALISLVDADRVFFKANVGMGDTRAVSRGSSLCALSILDEDVTVFEDALKEPCLVANPNVAGNLGLRFYAGAPLKTHDGQLIGTLCIIDKKPRAFDDSDGAILNKLAITVMDQIELRSSALTEIEAQHLTAEKFKLEAEKNISLTEELQLAINAANLGTWTANLATDLLDISQRSEEIHGLEPGEVFTLSGAMQLIVPEHRERMQKAIEDAIVQKSSFTTEYIIQPKDGSEPRWLLATGKATYAPDGTPLLVGGTAQDITEAKKNEQLKNDFIGMVSHELKTPLTSLSGSLQILTRQLKKQGLEASLAFLDKASNQVSKMTKMIHGFLDISRLESGKIHIDRQHFDMKNLIKEVEEETLSSNQTHTIIFDPVLITPVYADKDKISQVVVNYIGNALKYSAMGTTVQISCVTKQSYAEVCVRDEGMGIPAKDIGHVFDRYYRVDDNQMKTISGFGIGLYLCKEIVERHQGQVWAESEVNQGSKFYFNIPIAQS